jgi:DNA-directed RNA polymerase specialized sigma24 family protein
MIFGRARPSSGEGLVDVELVNRLVEDDTAVFPVFYRRYGPVIAHCIRGVIRGNARMETDDLLQDFFLKLQATHFRDLDRWNRQTPLSLFLRHIVRNFVIDRYRADPTSPGRIGRVASSEPDGDAPRQSPVTRFLTNRARLFGTRRTAPARLVLESPDTEDGYGPDATGPSPSAALESRQLRRRGLEAWARLTSARDRRLICVKFHRDTPADRAAAYEGLSAGAYRKAVFDAQKRHLTHLRTLAPEFIS